ncbi:MAG: 2Fe-2S iron-sulfur cluster binding domain-containing protein [Candidatus Puniceispirillum sp.]
MPKIAITGTDISFDCATEDMILRAALRAGHAMPYSCNVGSCGNCRFELVSGNVAHARADAPAWGERDQKRNRWLGCQAQPTSDCVIKFRSEGKYQPPFPPQRRMATLVGKKAITRDISEFTFSVASDANFNPGQYALLEIDGIYGGRAYSMSNLGGTEHWRFQIKKVEKGAVTTHLFDQMQEGDSLLLDGPYGSAFLDTASPRKLLLIAGGSGLSPMVSIARGAAAAGMLHNRELRFFYGGRAAGDVPQAELLNEISGLGSCVKLSIVLSDDASGAYQSGFVHEAAWAELGDSITEYDLYFAGPAVMAAAIQKRAYETGLPAEQMFFDEFY